MSLPPASDGSAALVTGASAGIGTQLSHELARRHHNLVLVARREELLRELAGELSAEHGIRAEALACDLTDAAARDALPGRIEALGLTVEVLINNAGFATNGPFAEADAARELQQVQILCEAPNALITAFLPGMVERGRGAILNVCSTAAMQPLPYSAGYSAAKAYLLTLSEAIHAEVSGRGVTVTALCPGPVRTDFWEISGWQVGSESFESAVPKPAWISPEQAASAGVKGLEAGHRVVVPGLPMRAFMEASRYLPHAFKLPALERMMRRR